MPLCRRSFVRTKKHRDKTQPQADPPRRRVPQFDQVVERFVYNNMTRDWKQHTKTTEPIRNNSKKPSLNVIMPPKGGVGSSRFKKMWDNPVDNSDVNAESEKRSRRNAWDWHEYLRKSQYMYEDEPGGKTYEEDELNFFRYATPGAVPPEDHPANGEIRPLIVDSGASQHMICESHLNDYERPTIKDLEKPIKIHTANGKVRVTQCCQIWVHELEMYVTEVILPKTADVLSLGTLVTKNGFSYHWIKGQTPYLEKHNKDGKGSKRIYCEVQSNVPYCVTGAKHSCLKFISSFDKSKPTIVNLAHNVLVENRLKWAQQPNHMYIGRANPKAKLEGSVWANPFTVREYGIDEALRKYEDHIRDCIRRDPGKYDLTRLGGKQLGCTCSPKACRRRR